MRCGVGVGERLKEAVSRGSRPAVAKNLKNDFLRISYLVVVSRTKVEREGGKKRKKKKSTEVVKVEWPRGYSAYLTHL